MTRRSPAWLPCPKCASENTTLVTLRGRPRRLSGAVLRGHFCNACRHRFVSIQRSVDDDELRVFAADVA